MCFARDMSLRDEKRIYIISNANEMSIYRSRRLYRILPTAKYIESSIVHSKKPVADCAESSLLLLPQQKINSTDKAVLCTATI